MSRVRVILLVLLSTLGVLSVSVSAAGPAAADWRCCGHGDVYSMTSSDRSFLVTGDWTSTRYIERIYPGQSCSFHDCDGFEVPPGCWANVNYGGDEWSYAGGGSWYKITDPVNAKVDLHC